MNSDLALADAFKALGDPIRLRLFYLLSIRKELCVCHLTDALELPQSTVSRHLAILRHSRLVQSRRDGKWMHYSVAEGLGETLARLVKQSDESTLREDAARVEALLPSA